MRRTGMITVCAAILTLFLAACGTKKQQSDGLVSMETAKSYEHVVKAENGEPANVPGNDNPPGQTGTPGGNVGNTPTPGGGADPDTEDGNQGEDIVYVGVSKLNLRSAPSLDADVIVQVKYGEALVRIEKGTNGWDKLLYNGQEVYAYADYLTEEKIAGNGNSSAGQFIADAKKKMKIVDTTKQLYSYDEMCGDIKELKERYPDRFQAQSIAVTADGREVYEIIFGNPDAQRAVIIQAGIHAREYMTSQLVMAQLEFYLCCAEDAVYGGSTLKKLFENVSVHVMPMMNPDGILISQYGMDGVESAAIRGNIKAWYDRDKKGGQTSFSFSDYLKYWKANANGVDLNRNFDYGFAEYSGAANPGAMKYKGTAPGSEPETAALIRRTEEINPALAVSYHASGSVIYWDYGQTGALRDTCLAMVQAIHAVNKNEIRYAATDKQDAAGYGDWLVMVKGIPSATIEIGVGTAPLSISEFEGIWDRNVMMWAALAEFAGRQP